MKLVGSPEDWGDLIDSFVPDILELIVSAWKEMPPLAPDALEDPTTENLYRLLQQHRDTGGLPFQIHIQMAELDPAAGEDQGRMDIAFLPLIPREDIYFCLECKRLNAKSKDGKTQTLTSEYITHGMLRFVRGQYAKRVKHGGMLAYVLDSDVDRAIKNVQSLIKKRFDELLMEAPGELLSSSIRPTETGMRETRHSRQHSPEIFQMHHFFVSASTACSISGIAI